MRSPMQKLFVFALVSSLFALGCELIVDFDRTKIVGEDVPETGTDGSTPALDATATETGTDATADTGTDAAADTGSDAADADTDGG